MFPSKREKATKNMIELLAQARRLKQHIGEHPTPIPLSFPTPETPESQAKSIGSSIYSIHIEGHSYDSP